MSSLPPAGQQILTSLIAYLFVAGAVNFQASGTSTGKNYFPQLPKTSPAFIARTIAVMWPAATAMLQSLNLAGDRAMQTWANLHRVSDSLPSFPQVGLVKGPHPTKPRMEGSFSNRLALSMRFSGPCGSPPSISPVRWQTQVTDLDSQANPLSACLGPAQQKPPKQRHGTLILLQA